MHDDSENSGAVCTSEPAEWAEIVEEYQQSGKSRSLFSVERGISVTSLDYHLLKQRRAVRTGPRLLPVELVSSPTSDAMLRVDLSNGRRIAVGAGFDAELLRRVVAANDPVVADMIAQLPQQLGAKDRALEFALLKSRYWKNIFVRSGSRSTASAARR
jgi:hypothetical protein